MLAVLEDPAVIDIARAHSKTPAQVLLRHLIQQDVIVIPKSIFEKRIQENVNVLHILQTLYASIDTLIHYCNAL